MITEPVLVQGPGAWNPGKSSCKKRKGKGHKSREGKKKFRKCTHQYKH